MPYSLSGLQFNARCLSLMHASANAVARAPVGTWYYTLPKKFFLLQFFWLLLLIPPHGHPTPTGHASLPAEQRNRYSARDRNRRHVREAISYRELFIGLV